MTDKLEIENQKDIDFRKQLEKIDWPISYGDIRIQIKNGKLVFVFIERAIKLD